LCKIEGCKYKIGGLRTNLKQISKIQEPNCKSVKELNYDLILEKWGGRGIGLLGFNPQLCGVVHHGPVVVVAHGLAGVQPRRCCGSQGLTTRSSGTRGDVRNPFQGSLGSGRCWEGEVGGSIKRNNDGEGSREQGEGGRWGSRGVVEAEGRRGFGGVLETEEGGGQGLGASL
jgi:hypothetical protein